MFRPRLFLFLGIAAILSGGVFLSVRRGVGIFSVGQIPVEISWSDENENHVRAMIDEGDLRHRLETLVRRFTGKNIWDVDLPQMRAELGRDEWVQDVLIARAFPNEIKVRIRPKSAVLAILSKQNKFIPVTPEGQLLSPLPAGRYPDTPLLRGEVFFSEGTEVQARQKRAEAARLLLTLHDTGQLSPGNISEVSWTASDGYVLTLVQPRVDVKLGEQNLETRALRVAQVMSYMAVNNLHGRVIDASFSKKVVVRLRKGP